MLAPSTPSGGPERSQRSRPAPLAAAAALLIAALIAVGCGSDDGEETTTTTSPMVEAQKKELAKANKIKTPIDASDVVKTFPPSIVVPGDVEAEKQGTPERAFLEWWQAYQFRDEGRVKELTSQATLDAIGEKELEEIIQVSTLGGIEVLDVVESGNTATVNAGLLNFQAPREGAPLPREPTASTPESFAMVKEDGQWRFDQADYLQVKVDALNNQPAP